MLKKMRWRFILSAMAAIFVVLFVLLAAMNLWYYKINTENLDETLDVLLDYSRWEMPPQGEWNLPSSKHSSEAQFRTRFFSVVCTTDGVVLQISKDYISSVSVAQAAEYAAEVLSGDDTSGYRDNYRFAMEESGNRIAVVFLNAETELQSMRTLLIVSCTVALISFLAIFVLVVLFSKRAILPFAKNIEQQKQFITDAGHEIKTPLTAIATSADILAMEGENEWVENIQSQTKRLARLVSDLVTLSRLDEANPFPEKTEFSLTDAIWEISESFAAVARAKGKQFSQEIADELTLRGNRAAVCQMVSILLDNAVKYSDEGGVIRLTAAKRHNGTIIEVYNTCHLPEGTDINRLFDRFYRPDQSRSTDSGGTGIGLSVARATAEAHGGKISVHSNNGEDILFRIVL